MGKLTSTALLTMVLCSPGVTGLAAERQPAAPGDVLPATSPTLSPDPFLPTSTPYDPPSQPALPPSSQNESKFRVILHTATPRFVTEYVDQVRDGQTFKVPVQRAVGPAAEQIILECDQISFEVHADAEGKPNYSFVTSGNLTLSSPGIRIQAKEGSLKEGKLSLKSVETIVGGNTRMRASDLELDLEVYGIQVTTRQADGENSSQPVPQYPTYSVPDLVNPGETYPNVIPSGPSPIPTAPRSNSPHPKPKAIPNVVVPEPRPNVPNT